MTQETGLHTLNQSLGARYYRLALGAAVERDLSRAMLDARCACELDGEHENAARLLSLCRYEKGEGCGAEDFPEDSGDCLESVRRLTADKKWREAALAAQAIPHKSVRVLNIEGCLWALAKDYTKGASCFARALGKDRSSRLAAEGLAELATRRKRFGIFLGGFYEKFV
jgi:hypothetical protein